MKTKLTIISEDGSRTNKIQNLQVSFAMNQIATDAAIAGPRGKGRKRARSSANGSAPGTGACALSQLFELQAKRGYALCNFLAMILNVQGV